MNKRLLSMFLALCMIVTMLPVSAMAEEIHTTIGGSGEIISFAPLTETKKAVSLGTSIEDLELPETLTATVRTAVPADENPTQDSGSPETATPTTASEPKWKETTGDIPVEWDSPDYDPNTGGVYAFTPVIEGYTVSAPLPEISVTVGAAMLIDKTQAREKPTLTAQSAETRDLYIVLVGDRMSPSSLGFLSNDCGLSPISTADSDDYAPDDDGNAMVKSYLYRAAVGQTITFHWGLGEDGFRGLLYAYYADDDPILDATFGAQWAVLRNSGLIGFATGAKQPIGLQFEVASPPVLLAPDAVTNYDIWVGGVQVASDNKADVLGAADGEGATVTYNSDTNTLTLNGATINGSYEGTWIDSTTSAYYGIYADTALKIEMVGDSTIIGKNLANIASIGIYTGSTLNLSGSGSLYVSGGTGKFSVGIYSGGSITIEGRRVTAVGAAATQTSIGIASNADITIHDGGVEASANTAASTSWGMMATDGFTINDGEVTASGKTGLHTNAAEGPVTISGGKVTANGSQVGIAGVVSVTSGTTTVKSDTKALNGSLTTSGYEGCIVTAGANKNGDGAGTYNAANLSTYKYIKVEPGAVGTDVAQIGAQGYPTLQAAVDDVTEGQTITLLDDITAPNTGSLATANQSIAFTVDFNGYTITASGNFPVIIHNGTGTITLKDSGENGGIQSTAARTIYINGGAIIINGGVFCTGGAGSDLDTIYVRSGSSLTINSGTIATNGTRNNAVFAESLATIKINGGTIDASGTDSIGVSKSIGHAVEIGVESGSATIKGKYRAMSLAPTLADGMQVTASTNYSGSSTVIYNAGNINNYKYLRFEPAPPKHSIPTIQIDYVSEALTGFVSGEQYSINGSSSFTVPDGDIFSIPSQLMGTSVSIVHKGDGATTSDSPAQTLAIPARPPAPSGSYYEVEHETTAGANDGKLKVTIADCEYRSLSHYSGFWLDIPQNEWKENLAPGIYYVRKKAVENSSFASENSAAIVINAGVPAPVPSLSVADVTLGAVTVGYMSSAYKSVVITNSGDAQATIASVTTDRPSVFSIHSGQSFVNANSSINSWQIRAATGLAVDTYTATITVTYDGGRTATATVSITVNELGSHTVTFNPNGGTVSEASRSVAPGTVVGTLPIPTRSGSYSFDGWYTAASGGTQISASTTVSANVTYYAHWTYTSGGGSGSGGGSSSNDNSSPVIVTPPAPDKPNSPTQGEIKVPGTVDGKGNVTVSITDKTVTDAFNKALAEAKKNGTEQNGITVVLRVDTGNKTGSNVTVNLPKAVQDTIIAKKIVNTIVVVDNPDIRVGMDLATVQEINKQAKSDVNITATRTNSGKLTGEAKKAIGSRPVFDLKVNYGNGKAVSSFGAGSVSVTIPYTLGANEKAGNVQAVYVDSKGKVHWLVNSVYDSVEKVLRFSTDHFSTYGIGYKQANTAFTDIAGHWAKEDIEFVASRGLFSGTSETKFSPNTAMTRGMFVTALGRLANADVRGYAKSSFSDVQDDAYYMGYIEWASKNNIVNGVGNGKFAPDQSVTREQMAVIMSNYAKTIGYTLPKVHIENIFTDNAKISTYAKEAVKQMQMAGVISGKNGNLYDPQGTATRAEVSAVLRLFVELVISSDTAQGWTMNDSGK
ncbi:MAG: S-layer homology domain-containing protein [Lacrimispora sp.]|uniref:S-layer homology domain-containing protein n=1 Tax=Lacrimispora sp. TaxID=2719234 RepID=UPI0039E3AD6F